MIFFGAPGVAAIDMGGNEMVRQANRLIEIGDGVVIFFQTKIRDAPVVDGPGERAVDLTTLSYSPRHR